jgi:glycosyltransferase involved in cell wall biosynthesis
VVGEALSRGLPVVVSDEVGTAEPVQGDCCRRFASGNIAEFESQVRAMIADLLRDPRTLRDCARQQAGEHFAPAKTAADLFAILENVAARRKPSALDRPLPEYSVASEMA